MKQNAHPKREMVFKAEVTQFLGRYFFQATYCHNNLHQQVSAISTLAEKLRSKTSLIVIYLKTIYLPTCLLSYIHYDWGDKRKMLAAF